MDHQEYHELLALYALDALDASEARVLEQHLSACAECSAELTELRDAAALLAHASTPAEPRAEVRARILAAARAESQPLKRSAKVVPIVSPVSRSPWPNVFRLAAAIAFIALLIGVGVFWRRDVRSRREIAQLSQQLNQELLREQEMLARQREALELLNSPGMKKMELAGTQTAKNARATFVFDQQTGRGMLMTDGLPAAPPDMAYAVWFIPQGHSPMPGKTFTVDAAGHAVISDQVPMEARQSITIAITLEPKRGSAVPTMPIYLSSAAS
ncbi:MAG: anti-sigma factor domain-containing protein [Acidobacteriota bacterium]